MSVKAIGCGDSWGSYIRDQTGFGQGGLFDAIQQVSGIQIINIADAGDSSEQTAGLKRFSRLRPLLPGAQLLFVSSGGDDIMGDQFRIFLNERAAVKADVTQAVNQDRFGGALALITADYEEIIAERNRLAPECRIVCHSYDFPVAAMMGHGVLWLGPWLQPGFVDRGWTDPKEQAQITQSFLREFALTLDFVASNTPKFVHVHTQGTLASVFGGDGSAGWANEAHPNAAGFTELANVVNLNLLPVLNSF